MDPSYVCTSFLLPRELHKRAREIARRKLMSVSDIVREALDERVRFFEAQLQVDDDRRAARAEEARSERRKKRTMRRLGDAPVAAPLPIRPTTTPAAPEPSPIDRLYEEHATALAKVIGDKDATLPRKKEHLANAVSAIVKAQPLSHPPEMDIVKRLERLVIERLSAAEAAAVEASDRVIDPSKITTRGDRL